MSRINVSGEDLLIMVVRYLLCFIFPPLAVFDKGCGVMLLVLLFTAFDWLPGTVLALLICIKDKNYFQR